MMQAIQAAAQPWTQAWREQVIPTLAGQEWDLIVVGGGIIGAGILREAARLGWRCLLLEQRDFAWGSSSRTSKMVHGGLRYIAQGQFALTRDSVRERQRLLQEETGLVELMPFLYPHYRGEFPGRLLLGGALWLYDRFAASKTYHYYPVRKIPQKINPEQLIGASEYQDALTDDAGLVMKVLSEARAMGAYIVSYVRALQPIYSDVVQGAQRRVIGLQVEDQLSATQWQLSCRVVAQAKGVWTDVAQLSGGQQYMRPLRGSHILVPYARLPIKQALSIQHPQDQRLLFILPWQGATIIGTTDLDHHGDLNQEPAIDQAELDYLLAACAKVFPEAQITQRDVVSTWSGVRPIVAHTQADSGAPSAQSREHTLWVEPGRVSIAGGKLTTFRLLALEVIEACADLNGCPMQVVTELKKDIEQHSENPCIAALPYAAQQRLRGRYGGNWVAFTEVFQQVGAEQVAHTAIYWAELIFACQYELVIHLDDLLLRRTRLGLLGVVDLVEQVRARCQPYLSWDQQRWEEEIQTYLGICQQFYSLP